MTVCSKRKFTFDVVVYALLTVEDLSDDPAESRLQLLVLYLRKRETMRRVIELLAG